MIRSRAALFLDRDGVINVDKHYVYLKKDIEFIDGIFDLCRKAIEQDMLIIVVTNQAGIGRGYYTEDQFLELTAWMKAQFYAEHASIHAVYFCPYHPEYGLGDYKKDSFDRKPNPGMFLRARDELGIDLSRSVMIGDKITDIQAAKLAGLKLSILMSEDSNNSLPDLVVKSLFDVYQILEKL